MLCPKCQFENREGAKFCKDCGVKLEFTCPKCGTQFTPPSKFCDECGYELVESTRVPPVAYYEPQSYTPKYLADKILTSRSSIEGERKLVTVLFADVANYTAISEKLDPEEAHRIMDGCFKILMDEIHKYEGTINQFTGDGVMALFGAPLAHEDHATRACYSALAIQKALVNYEHRITKEYNVEFKMRIGLNSGLVVVGSIGDDIRMDYTAVGDTTNLAARLESQAQPGSILVSKNTQKITKDFFEFKPMGKVFAKGKKEPQATFKLIRAGEVETRIKASVVKGLTKFVGRKKSIAALNESYEMILKGSGQVVGVVGEAGVGKSRLLLEFISHLDPSEITYLEGRCLHYGDSIIYMPVLEVLKTYFGIKKEDKEIIINNKIKEKVSALDERLVNVIPPFQDLLSNKVEDEAYQKLEPHQKRERFFEAIRDLFIGESQNNPIVLVLEDLHWIDNTSEEFLDYLIGCLPKIRIMLIILYRPEYNHQWGSKSYYTQIGLDQLGESSSVDLVRSIIGGSNVSEELIEIILSRSAGNPLFIEEFTHALLENDCIEKKNNKFVLSRKLSGIKIPDTIQGIIAARIDRLEDDLKRTMQVASVIGREFPYRILHAIASMKNKLKSYLIYLQGLEFIYEKSLFPELEYIFKHALTQEVAYSSLLISKRKEVHEKIGKTIENIYAERLRDFYEILAYHYSESDNFRKAYQYLKLSGEKANENYSNWVSFEYFKKAIDTLNQLPDTEEYKREQIEVRHLMISPMTLLGGPEGTLQILKEGAALSKELGDERSLIKFNSTISAYYSTRGDPLQSRKYAENGFFEAQRLKDVGLLTPLAVSLSISYNGTGEFYKIAEFAPNVITLLKKTNRESEYFGYPFNAYSYLCSLYGACMGDMGHFNKGKTFLKQGLNFAIEIEDLTNLGLSEMFYGFFYLKEGDGKNAVVHFQNSIKYFKEINFQWGASWLGFGYGYYLLGNLENAIKKIEIGLNILKNANMAWGLSQGELYLSFIHYDYGDLTEAQECVEKAIKLSQENHALYIEGVSRIMLGRILAKRKPSQHKKAEQYILQGLKIAKKLKVKPDIAFAYLCIGELQVQKDREVEAMKNLKNAEDMFKDMGIKYWLQKTQAILEKL